MKSCLFLVIALLLAPMGVLSVDDSYFGHAGATGTQHYREDDDPNYLRTNSEMPIMPVLHGYTGTHGKNLKLCKYYLGRN